MNLPFMLSPAAKDYLWGGSRLNDDFGKNIDMEPLAETWECSTHPCGQSVAAGGEFQGMPLGDILDLHPEYLGSHPLEITHGRSELPILIKLIDAKQDLSVQVHPDDEYARKHENSLGKTEMWYVLDAKRGASLVCPYAIAKQYGFWMVKEYREAYGMFAVNGILFNHESERRGENFVTRKITLAAGRIAEGLQDHLELGNMDSLRDWGYAKDYVECMWLIMQQEQPDDFVIATGEQHTVRDFTEKAFAANGITVRWEGSGLDEKGYDAQTGKMLVCVNPAWFRPTDVDNLLGDPTKARTVLGWNPQSTSYEQLVEIMAKHDRALAKREKAMKEAL